MENIISPITGSTNVKVLEEIDSSKVILKYKTDYNLNVERYFEGVNTVKICQCLDSNFRFYYPFSLSGDEMFYSDFQEALGNYYKPWRWEYTEALKNIKSDDKVLEIGTGSGIFFESLSKKVMNPVGLELSNLAIERAKTKGLNIKNELIQTHALQFANQYDVVCFFQVLEHITDIKSFLESAIQCLKPRGKLIIAVPNNNPYIYRYLKDYTSNLPPHHAGLWDKESLGNLESFFDIKTERVSVEPLYGIHYQLIVWAEFKKYSILRKILIGMPKIFIKILGKLAPFFDGVNIMAIYSKKSKL